MQYKCEKTLNVLRPIDDLEMPDTILLPLSNADIYYIGDLIIRTEQELLVIPGFTEDCLNGLKELLTAKGLSLETRLEHWPPAGWSR
jgi:DNA-directed RNA polymerase alpha subunit